MESKVDCRWQITVLRNCKLPGRSTWQTVRTFSRWSAHSGHHELLAFCELTHLRCRQAGVGKYKYLCNAKAASHPYIDSLAIHHFAARQVAANQDLRMTETCAWLTPTMNDLIGDRPKINPRQPVRQMLDKDDQIMRTSNTTTPGD